jgi:hypothetical protein
LFLVLDSWFLVLVFGLGSFWFLAFAFVLLVGFFVLVLFAISDLRSEISDLKSLLSQRSSVECLYLVEFDRVIAKVDWDRFQFRENTPNAFLQ